MPRKTPSPPRTEFREDATVAINCECGATAVLPEERSGRVARIRCKRCGRTYQRKSDGSYFLAKGVLTGKTPGISPAQAAEMMGLSGIFDSPGDTMARVLGIVRQLGILPTSPIHAALDRLRGAWAVLKRRTPGIDQDAAFEIDKALTELELWVTAHGK